MLDLTFIRQNISLSPPKDAGAGCLQWRLTYLSTLIPSAAG